MKNYDLILPIKKKWFDRILSGDKKEEYRENKYYWIKRLEKIIFHNKSCVMNIKFVNGYGKDRPYFIARCKVSFGFGQKEWGADPNKEYLVFKIIEVQK